MCDSYVVFVIVEISDIVEIVEIIEIEVVGDLKEDCGYIEIQRLSSGGLRLSKEIFDQNDAVSNIGDVNE